MTAATAALPVVAVVGALALALAPPPAPPSHPAPPAPPPAATSAATAPGVLGLGPGGLAHTPDDTVAATAAPGTPIPGRAPPAPGALLRPFEPPPHDYGPGHRGVDLAVATGQVLTAPADATVVFAGPVAGRGVVVLAHDGPGGPTRHALEPADPLAAVGARVRVGDPVASVSQEVGHAGCATACVHWGVRVDGRYVDPWWWLGLGGPVRLLPLDGITVEGITVGSRAPAAAPARARPRPGRQRPGRAADRPAAAARARRDRRPRPPHPRRRREASRAALASGAGRE